MEIELEPSDAANVANGHIPVLLEQAISMLNVRGGLTYIDATAGGGGHLSRINQLLQGNGQLIGLDRDPVAIERLQKKLKEAPITLINSNFADMELALGKLGISTISGGILADLGLSSLQLDDPQRGFTFQSSGPLDMRMDKSQSLSAAQLVNELSEYDLADIIYKYGEEKDSRSIAKNIVRCRPILNTKELADAVMAGHRRRPNKSRKDSWRKSVAIHPATRTFQALRIAVNKELESLEKLLENSRRLLAPGARLVIITFHSLEDRLVKQFFRRMASTCICPPRQPVCTCKQQPEFLIITRKPVIATEDEVLANMRSRSAKLRAGEKLALVDKI